MAARAKLLRIASLSGTADSRAPARRLRQAQDEEKRENRAARKQAKAEKNANKNNVLAKHLIHGRFGLVGRVKWAISKFWKRADVEPYLLAEELDQVRERRELTSQLYAAYEELGVSLNPMRFEEARYVNEVTGESQWEPPPGFQVGGAAPPGGAMTGGWVALVDEGSGETYYFNEQTGASQWDPPPGMGSI